MSQDRTDKRKAAPERARRPGEAKQETATAEDTGERKPSPIEEREWRGAGVCGDRHTD